MANAFSCAIIVFLLVFSTYIAKGQERVAQMAGNVPAVFTVDDRGKLVVEQWTPLMIFERRSPFRPECETFWLLIDWGKDKEYYIESDVELEKSDQQFLRKSARSFLEFWKENSASEKNSKARSQKRLEFHIEISNKIKKKIGKSKFNRMLQLLRWKTVRGQGILAWVVDGPGSKLVSLAPNEKRKLVAAANGHLSKELEESATRLSKSASERLSSLLTGKERRKLETLLGMNILDFVPPYEVFVLQLNGILENEDSLKTPIQPLRLIRIDGNGNVSYPKPVNPLFSLVHNRFVALSDVKILRALELTESQRLDLEEFCFNTFNRTIEESREIRKRTNKNKIREALHAKFEVWGKEFDTEVEEILLPHQIEMLDRICFRMRFGNAGLSGFVDADDSVLNWNAKRRKSFWESVSKIQDEYVEKGTRMEKKAIEKLLSNLSAEQQKQIRDALGERPKKYLPIPTISSHQFRYKPLHRTD